MSADDGTLNTSGAGGRGFTLTVTPGNASAYRISGTSPVQAETSIRLTSVTVDQSHTILNFSGTKTLTFAGLGMAPDGSKATVTNNTGAAIALGSNTVITFAADRKSVV